MNTKTRTSMLIRSFLFLGMALLALEPQLAADQAMWDLAKANSSIHRFSTLFTAHDVRDRLSTEQGLQAAVDWCRDTAVTQVYLEEFRDGYQAERAALEKAKARFVGSGFDVAGCITTTQLGKSSTGWKTISCYTDQPTQEKLQAIFEYAASLFNEIMIDDFWFTDCACSACETARKEKKVTVGTHSFPVASDSWEDYRRELMLRVSKERVIRPAKRINPQAQLIIKYPQWYDRFHERGYDVVSESAAFDKIWVGTETRDYRDPRWGGTPQYEGIFIMRWLGGIGGAKTGGGWYDWLGTTEKTYVEQARGTILGGARESLLFCYGGLQGTTGPENIKALRREIPELLSLAKQVRVRQIAGLAAYKPANSHPENEPRVFDFVGMLGLPLVPCHEFPSNAPAAFFSIHSLKQLGFESAFRNWLRSGKRALVTDGLAAKLPKDLTAGRTNVRILAVKGDPKSLLELSEPELNDLRAWALQPFGTTLTGPNKLGYSLFTDGSWVLQNFNDVPAVAELNGKKIEVPARGWKYEWRSQVPSF